MSKDAQRSDQATIDTLLKSLTSRPNVTSTLILSRKDGSIIRATGFPQSDNRISGSSIAYDTPLPTSSAAVMSSNEADERGQNEHEIRKVAVTPVQHLAGTIYEFVKASSIVATSVAQFSKSRSFTTSNTTSVIGAQSPDIEVALHQEDDVQLLRMRTRMQEVIIFPDPNYLCCVIQNVVKGAGRSEST